MTDMKHNEYFQRDWLKADAFRQLLGAIIEQLNALAGHEAWTLDPVDRDEYPPCWHKISGPGFGIMAEINPQRRLEVTLGNWPTYETVGGTSGMVTPRDLPGPFDDARMTADLGRDPLAIARDIARKVLAPGAEIMQRLRAIAEQRTEWARKIIAEQDALAAAVGEEIRHRSDQVTIYARNIPGETVRFELSTEEALMLLERLREMRQEATA